MREAMRHWAQRMWVMGTYAFLYLPIIILVIFSFNSAPFPAPWQEGTLYWYRALIGERHLWYALANSAFIACVAMFLSLGMSICFVYYCFNSGGNADRAFTLFYANLIIPEVVLAVGLLTIFSWLAISPSMMTLIAAHTVLALGYAAPLVYARYRDIDKTLIEAALDLGASRSQTFRTVIIPLLQPACMAAGLIVFIISFDDFLLSYFCGSSEAQTLSMYLLSMLRAEISPVINALSTLLLCVSGALVLAFCSINTRSKIL